MVIASALPFPHNPASRIVAATTELGVVGPPAQHEPHRTASQTDSSSQNRKDYDQETFKVENSETKRPTSSSGHDVDVPTDGRTVVSLPEEYKSDSSSRKDSSLAASSTTDDLPDSERLPQVSTAAPHNTASPAANANLQSGPEPSVPSLTHGSGPVAGSQRTPVAEQSLSLEAALAPGLDSMGDVGDDLFLDAHPRVLFSPSPSPPEDPPLLLLLETGLLGEDEGDREEAEDLDRHIEGHGDRAIERTTTPSWSQPARGPAEAPRAARREKRSHLMDQRRGERSVCEAQSRWVVDKKTAIDSHGQEVSILQEIQTQTGPLKQYFYETTCRKAEQRGNSSRAQAARTLEMGVAGAGCLGVDKKQWVSECIVKQSFVRALTKDANNRIGWRWIRINSSCVCVLLSRTSQALRREVLARKGRG